MRCILVFVCLLFIKSTVSQDFYRRPFRRNVFPQRRFACRSRTERAVCRMERNPSLDADFTVSGEVRMTQTSNCRNQGLVHFTVDLRGFPDDGNATVHGFHIHRDTDFSNGCNSFGPHFNPAGTTHGSPRDRIDRRHIGDLGVLIKEQDGVIYAEFTAPTGVYLRGADAIVGRSLIIHALPDDFGRGGDEGSSATGNAGSRLACCVIEREHAGHDLDFGRL